MKLLWLGSDTLFATRLIGGRKFPTKWTKYFYFLGMTVFAKIADLFVGGHCVVSEHLIENLKPLKLKKPFSVLVDPPQDMSHIKRVPHKGFNILYYRATGGSLVFKDWVYCYSLMKSVSEKINANWINGRDCSNLIDEINIIEINGDSDMDNIYPIVDIYVRPVMHDGRPRIIMECQQIGIPYFHKMEPTFNEVLGFIESSFNKNKK